MVKHGLHFGKFQDSNLASLLDFQDRIQFQIQMPMFRCHWCTRYLSYHHNQWRSKDQFGFINVVVYHQCPVVFCFAFSCYSRSANLPQVFITTAVPLEMSQPSAPPNSHKSQASIEHISHRAQTLLQVHEGDY